MQTHDRQLVSIAEAAARLGVSPKTIRRWIAAGRVTGFRAGPRLLRVDVADLDAVLRVVPTGDAS